MTNKILGFLFSLVVLSSHGQKNSPSSHQLLASNSRSDTADILKYTINLNITNFSTKVISGNTIVKFTPKVNGINSINLDLLKLTVDSIKISTTLLTYNYNDTLLRIALPVTHNIGDTSSVTVYYHGVPKFDAQWGGFYYSGAYAYNLGVGFDANPHNYGRVWFPCFDNFVEHSTFEFNITTNSGKVAYCNGLLTKDTIYASGDRIRTWKLNQEIPSYLANVAVAPYTEIRKQHIGINGNLPIVLAAVPADTINLKNSFIHLDSALSCFEHHYGPYLWDKVGYYLVPFTSGAMEHATSISYPRIYANGTLTFEDIMAHELSHHWFGDLITCETEGDMWINEGMASYSEHVFEESLHGKTTYKNVVRANHDYVLQFANGKEGGYRAVAGMPHQYTYGIHVYKKGADIAHTMRGYLGDSLFFAGLKTIIANNRYKNINTTGFMNQLSIATGVNMTNFFTDWVFFPGFPHFSVDSMIVSNAGSNYIATVHVRQKLTGAPSYFTNVPLELTLRSTNGTTLVKQIIMSGHSAIYQYTLSFAPTYAGLNLDEKINDAIISDTKILKTTGITNLSNARMEITVNSIVDSAFIKVDHNYTAPDPYKTPKKYRMSPNRYWKVDGILPVVFSAKAKINYDGTPSQYLDRYLINTIEDSLVLLYRKNAGDDWDVFPYYTKTMGGNSDKTGYITIDSLMLGEYVFAIQDINTSFVENTPIIEETINCSPNPANENMTFTISNYIPDDNYLFEIYNISGKKIMNLENINAMVNINCSELSEGIYLTRLININRRTTSTLRFSVVH